MELHATEGGVVLTFKNGRKVRTTLSRPLRPQENVVQVSVSPTEQRTIPLDQLCCISTGPNPGDNESHAGGLLEHVELITGERFPIQINPDEIFANGFFGISRKQSAPSEKVFIVSSAIRAREPGQRQEKMQLEIKDRPQLHLTEKPPLRVQERRVGDILIREGYVTREQVESALSGGERNRIGTVLIERGLISEDQLLKALAAKFGSRFVDLSDLSPTPEALRVLSKSAVNRMQVLPLQLQGRKLVVATSEPTDLTIMDNLRFITNYQIELVVAGSRQIAAAIDSYYNNVSRSLNSFITEMGGEDPVLLEQTEDEEDQEPDSKVIAVVNRILLEAYQKNVSDVHLEPKMFKGPLLVRYRIDGQCVQCHEIPPAYKNAIISRLKVMAKLDIAERRKPQSGKIYLEYQKRRIEYRLEITPTVGEQEDAVLRLLTSAKPLSLDQMGLSPLNLEKFNELVRKPYGIILCVGPTGSGKTTTLHSALATINSPERKIWTAEDPVEILQDGLRQVQVNPRIGYSFETALRSFLRADPDVIMIGEMRDMETTKTAVAASLTGHLVLSTLHTNSAPETVGRLLEMGLDPFNFADALLGIIAQRLARKLCDECKESYIVSRDEYEELVGHYGEKWFNMHGLPAFSDSLCLMRKKGCDACMGTGYKGRTALHELLLGSPAVNRAIKKNMAVEDLRELALQEGMRTLKMDGIYKVFEGVTDLKQVLKVCIL